MKRKSPARAKRVPNRGKPAPEIIIRGGPLGPRLGPDPDKVPGSCTYSWEKSEEICNRMAGGETLNQLCRLPTMPFPYTVRRWIWGSEAAVKENLPDKYEGFAARYAKARQLLYQYWADEIVDIVDDGSNDWMDREVGRGRIVRTADHEHMARSKLRYDARRWFLSKLPEYSDRIELTGRGGGPIETKKAVDDMSDEELLAIAQQSQRKKDGSSTED